MITRREAIKTTIIAGAALTAIPGAIAQPAASLVEGPFTLPALPYAYDALEPHIDARTMQIHHDKHHAAYVANLNKAVAQFPDLGKMSVEEMLKNPDAVPEKVRMAVRNNGGGDYNHTLFWQSLKKDGGEPFGGLATAMDRAFGGFKQFKGEFTRAAMGQFGSGWAWLGMGTDKKLGIETSANQDSPVGHGRHVLLGIDVWEHAYYLKYQNRRADYAAAFFNVINWKFVSERFERLAG